MIDLPATPQSALSPWGVCAHPNQPREWNNIDLAIKRCKEAGITWLREDIAFSAVMKKGDNNPDFTFYDKLLDKLEGSGIQMLAILEGYDWELAGSRADASPLYAHPESWRAFVRATALRYKGRLTRYEIWNEPDGGFWKPHPNAAQYVTLLKVAYEEIKAIDPNATVMVGGLVRWNAPFMHDIYKSGGKGYFDAIAVHPYGHGLDANPIGAREFKDFKKVLADNGDEAIPLWITESGGSTSDATILHKDENFMPAAIRYSLAKLGLKAEPGRPLPAIGLALSPRARLDEISTARKWLPGVELTPIPYDQLATLDPKAYPVVLGSEGLHIDAPLLDPLLRYVERGGLLLTTGWVPLFGSYEQRKDGSWGPEKDNAEEVQGPFRMSYDAWWKNSAVPASTSKVQVSKDALQAGVPAIKESYVDRVLTAARMLPGDNYYPIMDAFNSQGKNIGQPAALYTYHDRKGGVLAVCTPPGGDLTEKDQANLIPRMYLSYLAAGIEKIFWYDLHNDGQSSGEREHNFGLLRWDWSPKPSFTNYQKMTAALGAAPVFVGRVAETGSESAWALIFRRAEDGRHVLAAWSAKDGEGYNVLKKSDAADSAPLATVTGTEVVYRQLDADALELKIVR